MHIKAAVVILNYFGLNDTQACIKSVRTEYPGNVIYLVDNSADLAERRNIEDSFKESADVKMIFPGENLGFAAGVNLAIREAVADNFTRFLVLNNDAVLLTNAGLIFNNAFEERSGSLIAPVILWGGEVCRGKYYHKYLGLITAKPLWKSRDFQFYLTGCALAFDKTVLDKIGYLDESFFMYGEDVEFTYRACEDNAPLVLLDDTIVEHYGSRSSGRASFFYEYHINRAHFLLSCRLFTSFPCISLSLLGKSLTMFARAVFRSVKYLTFSPLVALFLAPFHLRVRPRIKP